MILPRQVIPEVKVEVKEIYNPKTLEVIIKDTITKSLEFNANNLTRVAKELKINRPKLKRYIKKLNIKVEENTRRNWR